MVCESGIEVSLTLSRDLTQDPFMNKGKRGLEPCECYTLEKKCRYVTV
jgi:hypothetical protein